MLRTRWASGVHRGVGVEEVLGTRVERENVLELSDNGRRRPGVVVLRQAEQGVEPLVVARLEDRQRGIKEGQFDRRQVHLVAQLLNDIDQVVREAGAFLDLLLQEIRDVVFDLPHGCRDRIEIVVVILRDDVVQVAAERLQGAAQQAQLGRQAGHGQQVLVNE